MRGLEITLFLISIILALPLVSVLLPVYNSGAGISTGANDLSRVNAFNWSAADKYKTSGTGNILDQATYFLSLAGFSVQGIASIIFSSLWAAPDLLSIFGINPVLGDVLLAMLAIVLIIAWLQIIKGDDWSGRR